MTQPEPVRFIGVEIEVIHDRAPRFEKKPGVPDGFVWQERTYRVATLLKEWHDYRQRGKTKTFYTKERGSFRAKAAERRGSWGVGRDYYRVRTESGELFELYCDRAPKGAGRGKGSWVLFRQLEAES